LVFALGVEIDGVPWLERELAAIDADQSEQVGN
jgi:hypothetical protein